MGYVHQMPEAVIDAVHQESIQHQGEVMNRPMDPGHKASSGELKSVKSENSPK